MLESFARDEDFDSEVSVVASRRGLEAIDVVAKPRAGFAAGFFFFFVPAMGDDEESIRVKDLDENERNHRSFLVPVPH